MVLNMQLLPQEFELNQERSTVKNENSENKAWEQIFNVIQKSF